MKIAIAGYGVEGESSYRYWSSQPDVQLTIVDEKQPTREIPDGAKLCIGETVFAELAEFDMVIRTPGLAPSKIQTNGKIWSATNEFFAKCQVPIIGVTGSKGKGTTASLIAAILQQAGKKVWLVGNIGQPALDILAQIQDGDIVVYELSSFQLWDIEKSPQTAVVLFIEQEHLDVHVDMDEYVDAKAHIARFQTANNIMIYNQENAYSRSIADQSAGVKVGYTSPRTAHIFEGAFYNGDIRLCSLDALQLPGDHNQDNACAAIDAVWSITQDPQVIEAGLRSFKGLEHRLQFVREVDNVQYFDDSIATTPGSAIAALRAFEGPKVIILGGSSKGSDFTELGRELTRHDVTALLIGDQAQTIAHACDDAGFSEYQIVDGTMDSLVAQARSLAVSGGVVLLSPASASFGLFKNYVDRGEQFTRAVWQL